MLRVVIKLIYLEPFYSFQTTILLTAWAAANPLSCFFSGGVFWVCGWGSCLVLFCFGFLFVFYCCFRPCFALLCWFVILLFCLGLVCGFFVFFWGYFVCLFGVLGGRVRFLCGKFVQLNKNKFSLTNENNNKHK